MFRHLSPLQALTNPGLYAGSIFVLTWLNVVPDDTDVLVAVRSRVFVPESNHVTQFVHHNAELVAVFPDRYGLWAASAPADIGAAPVHQRRQSLVNKCVFSQKRQPQKRRSETIMHKR